MARIGAKSRDTIEPSVLDRLNLGTEESASLSEALAVDFGILLGHVVPSVTPEEQQRVTNAAGLGFKKRMNLAATVLVEHLGNNAAELLQQHPSDTARGWVAFVIGNSDYLSLGEKLSAVRSLADDRHFGVREWAWLALRPAIAADLTQALVWLLPWVMSESENIRRFAIEATRPRGVWSKHIQKLKESPAMGQVLLNEVMEDSSRYVQDSCGNWLNDAAKSNPQWVVDFCAQWQEKSYSVATSYIIKRGLRNVA